MKNCFSLLVRVRHWAILIVRGLLFLGFPNRWSSNFAGSLNKMVFQIHDDHQYKFMAAGPLLFWRARTLFTKEPETINWLKSIPANDVLYDIGANIGIYSIYAGVRGARVISFEPEASNYAALNRNIYVNNLSKSVKAYSLALSNHYSLGTLRLSSIQDGAALHSFGVNKDYRNQDFNPVFEQGCLSMPLDLFLLEHKLPPPNFIKVDVDGLESNIMEGASHTLSSPSLKGLLIEINEEIDDNLQIINKLESLGFQVTYNGNSEAKAAGKNYIFTKRSELV